MGTQGGGYRVLDSAGCVIGIFRDLYIAEAMVRVMNSP
jgi:hypothetical protein